MESEVLAFRKPTTSPEHAAPTSTISVCSMAAAAHSSVVSNHCQRVLCDHKNNLQEIQDVSKIKSTGSLFSQITPFAYL